MEKLRTLCYGCYKKVTAGRQRAKAGPDAGPQRVIRVGTVSSAGCRSSWRKPTLPQETRDGQASQEELHAGRGCPGAAPRARSAAPRTPPRCFRSPRRTLLRTSRHSRPPPASRRPPNNGGQQNPSPQNQTAQPHQASGIMIAPEPNGTPVQSTIGDTLSLQEHESFTTGSGPSSRTQATSSGTASRIFSRPEAGCTS